MSTQRPRQTDLVLFRKVLPFLKTAWPLYATALVIAPLSAVGAVAQPYLLKVALDDYIAVGDVDGTRWIALAYLGMVVVTFLLEAGYTLAISHAAMQTIAKVRETVYTHTLSLSRRFFDHQPSGRLLTRATSDVEALGETLTAGALTIALDVVKVIGILVAMFLLDAWLSLVMLLMAPIIVIVVELLRRILRRLYLEIRTSLSELNAYISERFTGLEIVQLYTDEARSAREHVRRLHRYRDATIRTNVYDAALYAIIDGLGTITMALMLLYGAGALFEGSVVTAGLLAAFIDYIARLYRPIQEFSSKVAVIQRAVSALEKIFGLLDVDDHILEGDHTLEQAAGRISVRDVSFSYGEGPRILSDVSLDLQPGATIAVVGRTGSGKTTLGKVLSRAYDGYTGSITIDGHELRTLDAASARRCVATVQQDVQLFPGPFASI